MLNLHLLSCIWVWGFKTRVLRIVVSIIVRLGIMCAFYNTSSIPNFYFPILLIKIMCAFGKHVCVSQTHVLRFQPFFFFLHVFQANIFTIHSLLWLLFMNSSHNIWLFLWIVHDVYCSRTHKFYFLTTFSLKMGPTVLFTHLKIILLQYFSVFSFQFSAVSKQTLNLVCLRTTCTIISCALLHI